MRARFTLRTPRSVDKKTFMSNREIREWLCSVGFKPAGMPEDDDEEPLRLFFEERSRFIVQHIPWHSEEDKEKESVRRVTLCLRPPMQPRILIL